MKCAGCKKFGHFKKCCNAITRAKARDTKESNAKAVMEEDDDTQSLGLITLAMKKEEKKVRQREKKANAKEVEVVENEENAEVITINHIKKPANQARSIVWCPKVNRFVQKI